MFAGKVVGETLDGGPEEEIPIGRMPVDARLGTEIEDLGQKMRRRPRKGEQDVVERRPSEMVVARGLRGHFE